MPARMWKHSIHTFFEVLSKVTRLQLAFIYVAYQIMALILKTALTLTDTKIECLGDLACSRMAIEDEEAHHATRFGHLSLLHGDTPTSVSSQASRTQLRSRPPIRLPAPSPPRLDR